MSQTVRHALYLKFQTLFKLQNVQKNETLKVAVHSNV